MLKNISKKLKWIKKNPKILKKIYKGIEREGLRINNKGKMSKKNYPKKMGYSLTNEWITTDFSENLLEIITPKTNNNKYLLNFLNDTHKYIIKNIKKELIWPFSIPCKISNNTKIKLAKYGKSNIGLKKTLYRKGLQKRYGTLMNMVSGIHYNFSLPKKLLNIWIKKKIIKNKSEGYLNIIRNYYRFGWIIPYLFGSSPAIPKKYIKNEKIKFKNFKKKYDMIFLPWSTSLRLGQSFINKNNINKKNKIKFNSLKSYIKNLKKLLNTPCKNFKKIGLKNKKNILQQINTNILQMESELYTQIRPKRNTKKNNNLLKNLKKKGIEYIEIRSLDINPFSSIGINKKQILILDIFLIWCFLEKSPKINNKELNIINKNWKKIIFEGRKPKQKIINSFKNIKIKIKTINKKLYKNLIKIAKIFDICFKNKKYTNACKKFKKSFINPKYIYSEYIMKFLLKKKGMHNSGLYLSNKYKKKFEKEKFKILNKKKFFINKEKSIKKYKKINK